MIIPQRKLARFARDLINQCMISRVDRVNQNTTMTNYALSGGEDSGRAAVFNKTYAYLDDLQSLLYSPVSLRFHIGDPDYPDVLHAAKGRAAAAKLRIIERRTDTDTLISDAVWWSLVKGKTLIKSNFKKSFETHLVQPDNFGVRNEAYGKLDENMEAFCQCMPITFEQFVRMVWKRNDRDKLIKKAQQYSLPVSGERQEAQRQVITGGLYPYQPASSGQANQGRGIVDWLGSPKPSLDPQVHAHMLELCELWVWNDEHEDWNTFHLIGDDILLTGEMQLLNAFAYNKDTSKSDPNLKGHHPYTEVCVNPIDGYFWGRSEILNVALLQDSINVRIDGINRLLRRQEDPSYKIKGAAGVNQNAITRFKKPGGYWSDVNPTAEIQTETPQISADIWASVHENERMFDEMGGLPPTARGHGEAGVRSHAHAETLVRMFSPRFKDRALLAERCVEALGGLHLDMAKAHIAEKLNAWVPAEIAGDQGTKPNSLLPAPAKGLVAVPFNWSDLDEDQTLTIDSHSSSPAFSAEAKSLAFDLLKVGAMSPEELVERSDVSDPEEMIAGIQRRAIAKQEAEKQAEALKLQAHAKK